MCFLGGTLSKVIDPGGFIAEKTLPKPLAPYAGLHGTMKAMKQPTPLIQPPASRKLQSDKLLGE